MKALVRRFLLGLRGAFLRPFYPPAANVELESIRTVLVLRFDRIGDMVCATPLLEALREELRDAKIDVLASEENAPVLEGNPFVDRVHVLPRRARASFLAGLSRSRFDLMVDPYFSYDWAWLQVSRSIHAKYRLGLDLHGRGAFYNIRVPAPLPAMSASESMLQLCRVGLKRPLPSKPPKVYIQKGETELGWNLLREARVVVSRPIVIAHPGGYYSQQRWPAERFARVAAALVERGWGSALIGGPSDESLLARASALEPAVKIIRTRSLRQLVAVLSCARLLICNNSGPLHLACALGVRTLSTLGPTDAVLWAPRGPGHRVVVRNPLEDLRVEEMEENAVDILRQTAGIAL